MRTALIAMLLATTLALPAAQADHHQSKKDDLPPALRHTMETIRGKDVKLSRYHGKVVLIVNVASECGFTPQYEGLQKLHERFAGDGLAVLGFPCNQFAGQEPGSDKEIRKFCTNKFGVKFDMFSKIKVNGDEAAPLYKYLTSDELPVKPRGKIQWNFEKFLLNRQGEVIARWRSKVKPESEKIVKTIKKALAAEPSGN